MLSFTITPIVRQAVIHRLEELERTKVSFEQRYLPDAKQSEEPSVVRRIEKLLRDVENLDPKFDEEDGDWVSGTINRCIEQTQDDKAISENKLLKLEKSLRDRLSRFRNRMEVSCLHARLMKEMMSADTGTATTKLEIVALEDDFDVVDNDHEDILERFEKACSQPTTVDTHSIDTYLSSLFTSEDDHLQVIRNGMREFGDDLSNRKIEVAEDRWTWIITGLIRSDYTSQERKAILANFLQSPNALRELAATLNIKSFREWNYRNAEEGLPVDVRKTTNGQYYVNVEADVIDMLFLHCCAIGWAVKLNECFGQFVRESDIFRCASLTGADRDKRSFFFDEPS